MHGYSRLGLPRGSPPSSPRCRHGRSKTSGRGAETKQQQSIVERAVFFIISVVFRRRGMLLFAPLLYISGMLLYMGSVSFDVVSLKNVVIIGKPSLPASVYRSPQVFQKLWPFMQAESNHTPNLLLTVWNSKVRKVWKPCILKDTLKAELPKSNGLFIIEANGGLNQQRLSVGLIVAK